MAIDPTMTDYAGDSGLWPLTFRLISDATRSFSDRIALALKTLADRTAWQRAQLAKPIYPPLFSGITPTVAFPGNRFSPVVVASGGRSGWLQRDVSTAGQIAWHVKIPTAVRIAGVTAYVLCEPTTLVALPATMPKIRTSRQPTDGSDSELLVEAIDPSPDAPAFNAYHAIGGAWMVSPDLLPGDTIVIDFQGMEGGGAFVDALKLVAIKIDLNLISPVPA